MQATQTIHRAEVRKGERFEFGKNWTRFLAVLNDARIALAERSLRDFLGVTDLAGKSFLDIGSGSGLFSLAARRLGARVRSFDYDPHSVACTKELRRRYFPDDPAWQVEEGSVLDRGFLATLGQFDVVYSWGVLHHTGAMWQALENVKPLVPIGGQLFIAIYNEWRPATDRWLEVKRRYNSLPSALKLPYALQIIAREEWPMVKYYLKRQDPAGYFGSWTHYGETTARGMSRWHDWIDWIGGYPYENASVEAIADYFAKDGFAVTRVEARTMGYGCNEFVFRREAAAGILIDRPLPGSSVFARRFGRKIQGPVRRSPQGWLAAPGNVPAPVTHERYLVFKDGAFTGEAPAGPDDSLIIAPSDAPQPSPETEDIRVATAVVRPLDPPYTHVRGHMWSARIPDLAEFADDAPGRNGESPVHLFENGRQLAFPHTVHEEIARYGRGRFSHWADTLFFSTPDNGDPNLADRRYCLIYPAKPAG